MKLNGVDFDTYFNEYPNKEGYFGKYGGVYVDEKLERKDVKYVIPPTNVSRSYIRYFDRKAGYHAAADNLKVYVADTPEFIVPTGLTFKK